MNLDAKISPHRTAAFVWCVLLVLSACVVVFAFRTRECFVDDAFIGFQYVGNLLAGEGFVFHADDTPIEGVTNIGWLLALAPLCKMAAPTVVAKLAGLALVLLTLILSVSLGQGLAVKAEQQEATFGWMFFPALMLATSFEFLYFSLAGMETALLATILLLMACIALHRPQSFALPLLGALAFLVHPEAVIVYPLYAVLRWWQAKEERRSLVGGGLLLVAALGLITAVRFVYFHDVVPNTFHSKPSDWRLALQNGYAFLMGQNTNVAFPITGWLAIAVLLLGYRRLQRAKKVSGTFSRNGPSGDLQKRFLTPFSAEADMLAAVCAAGLVFAVYSLPDWTALPRYFAPYLPAALILLWAGLGEAIAFLLGAVVQPRTQQAIALVIALLLVLTNVSDSRNKMSQMESFPGYVLAGKNLVGPAEWMRDHLPEGATVATRRIGVLAYHSHRRVFDYTYGLPDAEVARLVARHGQRFDTPTDPALAALWQSRAPDCLLEDGDVMDDIISQAKGTRQRFSIHGIEYQAIERFPIGLDFDWVLAHRITP